MVSITSLKTKVKTKVKKLTVLFGSAAVMTLSMNVSAMAAIIYDVTDLGNLGQPFSFARDINDQGQVVGYSGDTFSRAFLWSSSTGITDLGALPGGDNNSAANGINNAGQVVGSSGNRAFLWSQSTGMTDLGTLPGRNYSGADAINNKSQVVGSSGLNNNSRAFLWNSSTGMTDLGTLPGESSSSASDINDKSQVVGSSGDRAFIWNSTTGMADLGTLFGTLPGQNYSAANAINNKGQVVGYSGNNYGDTTINRAFLWSSSTGMTDLGTLPSQDPENPDYSFSYANDINDAGQVVGYSLSAYSPTAFLWSKNTGLIDLNTLIDPSLDFRLDVATAINNRGQIVGWSRFGSFDYRAFLLTPKSSQPVPEPMTIGGSILAGAGLVYLRRRQARLHR